jgi:hypothetical protein
MAYTSYKNQREYNNLKLLDKIEETNGCSLHINRFLWRCIEKNEIDSNEFEKNQGSVDRCMHLFEEGSLSLIEHFLGQHLQCFGIKVDVGDLQQLLSQIP